MEPSRLAIVSISILITFSLVAHSQDGEPIGSVMCFYGPGDYRACESEPTSTPDPTYEETVLASDPMEDYRLRYATVLQRLRELVDGLQAVPTDDPQSTEEMSARLSVLYTAAAFRLDSLSVARDNVAAVRIVADSDAVRIMERIQERQDGISTAPTRKASADNEYATLTAERHRLEAIMASLESQRVELALAADQSAMRVVQWLAMVGMPDVEVPFVDTFRKQPAVLQYLSSLEMTEPRAYLVPDVPRLPVLEGHSVEFRLAPVGTVDELLVTVENLVPQIESATQALAEESPAAAQAEARANALEISLQATTQIYRDVEGEVNAAEFRVENARELVITARQNSERAAINMLTQAVETTLLGRLANDAKAAVKEFVTINADAETVASLTDQKVAEIYQAGQVVLRTPTGSQFEQMNKFLETQQAILAYARNPLESAISAGNALGNGDPNAGVEEALAVFRGLRRDALEIVETVTEELPPGVREHAMRLVDEVD